MDQSALLSVFGGMYDKLVQDVSNRVYGMMLETERARESVEINYEKLADQIDWKGFARDVAANFSPSDLASEIDLGDLVTELDYGAIAEGLDVEKVADEIDMDEKVREVLRGL
jgi:hypothetical protein